MAPLNEIASQIRAQLAVVAERQAAKNAAIDACTAAEAELVKLKTDLWRLVEGN